MPDREWGAGYGDHDGSDKDEGVMPSLDELHQHIMRIDRSLSQRVSLAEEKIDTLRRLVGQRDDDCNERYLELRDAVVKVIGAADTLKGRVNSMSGGGRAS